MPILQKTTLSIDHFSDIDVLQEPSRPDTSLTFPSFPLGKRYTN